MSVGVHKPQHKQRCPRTTFQSWFSPSAFLWVTGIKLKVLVFIGKCVYPPNHLTKPST